MKIRSKLTLRYLVATAAVFSLFAVAVYIFSEKNREREFFRGLRQEAVTKGNLFLSGRVDASIMQSVYRNNREFINETEVAVYTKDFVLLYHDAQDIDIIKETPELIRRAIEEKDIRFYEGGYQAVAMSYLFDGEEYIITAAAYDGYGYAKRNYLSLLLLVLWVCGLVILSFVGYLLAKSALAPVSRIVDEVDAITASNLNTRLVLQKSRDELNELSETFNRMLDRIEESFDNQKMFVSNVAHELRTPLAALTAELELALLREQRTEHEYREVIGNALNDAKRLEQLTTGLLNLAKAGYASSQIVMEQLRLDELLLDARAIILKGHPNYVVELIFDEDADDDRLITIIGNEYLLKTAFVNLIENNCKYSEDHTSHVNISFYETLSVIRFTDNGIGIAKEEVGKIFTPFYRGTNSGQAKGQGIGLALAEKIITLHKGQITVHSQLGEGTAFVVEVPHI